MWFWLAVWGGPIGGSVRISCRSQTWCLCRTTGRLRYVCCARRGRQGAVLAQSYRQQCESRVVRHRFNQVVVGKLRGRLLVHPDGNTLMAMKGRRKGSLEWVCQRLGALSIPGHCYWTRCASIELDKRLLFWPEPMRFFVAVLMAVRLSWSARSGDFCVWGMTVLAGWQFRNEILVAIGRVQHVSRRSRLSVGCLSVCHV